LLLIFFSVFLTAAVSARWAGFKLSPASGVILPALFSLMPTALYCYITGQASPLVGCALVLFAWFLTEKTVPPWVFALLALITTFKPHIAILPMSLCLLEMIRTASGGRWSAWRSVRCRLCCSHT
jgi:hypothetical protein